MRIFFHHQNLSPEDAVREALDSLVKAGIYSAQGGATINDRALILIEAAQGPEAIAALTKAGLRAVIG